MVNNFCCQCGQAVILDEFWQTTLDALHLLVSLDAKRWEIVAVSFSVSLTAIALVLIPLW